jgi:hypothetical protein
MADTGPDASHDFAVKWTQVPEWRTASIGADGIGIHCVEGLHQILVSGKIARAVEALLPGVGTTGLWGIADEKGAWVRIGRDRALLVSGAARPVDPGWNSEGWCATQTSDAWRVFEIAGPRLKDFVRRAVSADFEAGSPSAAVLFAGLEALVYRVGQDRARLHVDAPLAAYVWRWMEEQARISWN